MRAKLQAEMERNISGNDLFVNCVSLVIGTSKMFQIPQLARETTINQSHPRSKSHCPSTKIYKFEWLGRKIEEKDGQARLTRGESKAELFRRNLWVWLLYQGLTTRKWPKTLVNFWGKYISKEMTSLPTEICDPLILKLPNIPARSNLRKLSPRLEVEYHLLKCSYYKLVFSECLKTMPSL